MVDIVSIVVSIVVVIILIGVSFYLYVVYSHRKFDLYSAEDKGVGVAIPSKILIVVGQALAWGQLLIIPLDVSTSSQNN